MTDMGLGDYAEFAGAPIFSNLENINLFHMSIEVPQVYRWMGTAIAGHILGRLYDETSRAIDAAGFYSADRLKPVLSQNSISVEFGDDEFGFSLAFDEDGDLILLRRGSSFARFHEWYRRFMPSLESLVSRVLQGVVEESSIGRPTDSAPRLELTPIRAQYRFRFVGYDFREPPSNKVVRNAHVMTRLVQSLPGSSGHLESIDPATTDEFGRMDVKLSRWSDHPMGYAREIYSVEAPANRRYSSIWFDFSYVGEGRDLVESQGSPFNASSFLSEVELPLEQFLRVRAIEAFMADLTRGFIFDTTPSYLP